MGGQLQFLSGEVHLGSVLPEAAASICLHCAVDSRVPSPPSEPWQAQETLGLVSLLYGLETTLTAILLPNEGQSRDFGIRTRWAFGFTSMLPDHQPHASVLRQEKKN